MYINNPDQFMLDACFKCNSILANYLMRFVPLLYRNGKDYYFVRTIDFEIAFENMPNFVKFMDFLKF
jgi:hypothetical protein